MLAALAACSGNGKGADEPKSAYDEQYERCLRYGGTPQICEQHARFQAGPPEKPVDEATWSALEDEARGAISAPADAPLYRITNASNPKAFAEYRLNVLGNHCYDLGFAWAHGIEVHGSIGFVKGADGRRAHNLFAVQSMNLAVSGEKKRICADRKGEVLITLTAVQQGVLTLGLLEVALAVVETEESAEETAARVEEDEAKAAASTAETEGHLQRADRRKGGEAFARACARCRKKHRACYSDTKDEDGCREEFLACADVLARNKLECAY